ncbi:MAG TPA: tetratricopeptide repeat protein [Polyangia bacterium]|nr:tetratricopeptide repeat protein [Polyangia bacterium]
MTALGRWWRDRRCGCPPAWRLGQAASQGLSEPLAAHVASCARCARQLVRLRSFGRRARTLGATTMPRGMRDRIAEALRVEVAGQRPRAWSMPGPRRQSRWAVAGALALMLAGSTLLAAIWRRTDGWRGPVPVAAPVPAALAAPAAPTASTALRGPAGDSVATQPSAPEPVVAADARTARRRKVSPRPAAARLARAESASPAARTTFERGWALLRDRQFNAAADAFGALERGSPGDATVEDALFWRGVAFARAGVKLQARAAVAAFVSRFPGSPRAGEASAQLGWLLLDAGDRVGARARFERAARDPSEAVRDSARSGLQQIESSEAERAAPPAHPGSASR